MVLILTLMSNSSSYFYKPLETGTIHSFVQPFDLFYIYSLFHWNDKINQMTSNFLIANTRPGLLIGIIKRKYFDLAKKKLWNMKVTVMPIVVGAFQNSPKSLAKKDKRNWKS